MEKGHNVDAPAMMRRKRKVARQLREKTPEPTAKIDATTTTTTSTNQSTLRNDETEQNHITKHHANDADNSGVQTIKMQIRPPGSMSPQPMDTPKMSAHKSKILSRRNKNFAGAAKRSLSAPRERELENTLITSGSDTSTTGVSRLPSNTKDAVINSDSNVEILQMLRSARRSLSSPRHKEDSGESGPTTPVRQRPILNTINSSQSKRPSDDERLTRLERNLQRFEQERRKFEIEKLLFERERRELHRMRYKQIEREDRKRLLESYKKFHDRIKLPTDDINNRLSENVDDAKQEELLSSSREYELSLISSTEESSDAFQAEQADDEEEVIIRVAPKRNQSRRNSSMSPIKTVMEKSREPSTETVRERKKSLTTNEGTQTPAIKQVLIVEVQPKSNELKKSFFSKFFSIFTRKPSPIKKAKDEDAAVEIENEQNIENEKLLSWTFIRFAFKEFRKEWLKMKSDYPEELTKIRILWNKCIAHTIVLALFCGFGGLTFRFIEGSWENIYKCEIRKVKRDFIDQLWLTSHNLREDDWKSSARNKLRLFEEQLQTAFEAGVRSYSEITAWSFVNSVMFCLTVVTSIGYGHIAPKTGVGRAVTIIYAIIGIPMFLIVLADFGKLFTRMIKFLWAYVRRLYYTGTCRSVRKQRQYKNVMKGMYTVYDYTIRRPSTYIIGDAETGQNPQNPQPGPETPQTAGQLTNTDAPTTPYPESFAIDDEFNLPISVATAILLFYIFSGALVYVMWEDWSYFESFYFVFVSMSTIGFGDFVPNHPIFMMCSIIYLVFGLALTSMVINVVQIKLSDSFKQASAKIGATIGLVTDGQNTPAPEIATKLDNIPEMANETDSPKSNHKLTSSCIDSTQETNQNEHNDVTLDNVTASPPPLLPRKSKTDNNNSSENKDDSSKSKKKFFF